MTIQEALSILKPEAHTMDALKSAYRAAALKYHPDRNPHGLEMMKLVNAAMDLLATQFNAWTLYGFEADEKPVDEALMAIFDKIKHCVGIKAEVCGTWLWINGNTRAYKDIFKSAGMKWSQNKVAWYWHPEGYRKRSRRTYNMDTIRTMWGSTEMDTEPLTAMA